MTVHEQAAGFVLDALDGDEAREFERHLRVCPACEDALEPLRLAAVALAFAGELPRPHPELRLRVLDIGGVVLPFRRRWTVPVLSAAAVAAASVAVVVGVRSWSGETRGLSAAGLHAFATQGADGTLLVAGSREAVLVVRGLPSPAAGTAYEVWIVRGGSAVPAGFLRGQVARLTRPLPRGAAVAVSLEPADGSRRPTGPLLLRAETA